MEKEKKAFILGTGPSLNKIDITKLKEEVTITFNRAYLAFDDWGFDPTYYLIIDGNDIRSLYKDINNLILERSIQKFFLLQVEDNYLHKPMHFQDEEFKNNDEMYVKSDKIILIKNTHNSTNPILHDIETSENIWKTTVLPNAGFMGLKTMYNLGYKKLYLCGMDARYQDDTSYRNVLVDGGAYKASTNEDINHFRPDYFGKDVFFGKPNQDQIISIWRNFMLNVKPKLYPDLKIYSCSENSNLNEFIEFVEFNSIVNEYK